MKYVKTYYIEDIRDKEQLRMFDEEVNKENDKGMQVKHTESVAYGTNGILKTITFDGHEKLTWEEQLQFWQVENEMMDSDRKLREEMRMSWYIKLFNKIVGG